MSVVISDEFLLLYSKIKHYTILLETEEPSPNIREKWTKGLRIANEEMVKCGLPPHVIDKINKRWDEILAYKSKTS